METKGKIQVHSENMMPIIKKWLYSDRDIFIRELVSNACDAISKLNKLRLYGEAPASEEMPRIDITVTDSLIKISDNGLGMTAEEVEKYINQVAFSGAEEFIKKYSEKGDAATDIIGHFGLGFYSAFMVSEKVEIQTKSFVEDAQPICWICDGGSDFTMTDGVRTDVGTEIILHISEDSKDFANEFKLKELLTKYCAFMPYPIYVNSKGDEDEKPVNNTSPLWNKDPKDCTDEDYIEFYKSTFKDFKDPLFWIHLNVSHPFTLKGILYFPRYDYMQPFQGKVSLYNSQVFVADNIKEIIPEFMMLLKGVIDCPEMPLNVSRSFLQNDETVKQISAHITKKVADKLVSLFKNDREKYNSSWADISPFVKYGCFSNEKFYDRVKDILIAKTINDEFVALNDYAGENKIIYYVTDAKVQSQYINMFRKNSQNAIYLDHEVIDKHFISHMEFKHPEWKFMRVDSDISEDMKEADDCDYTLLIDKFKNSINNEKLNIKTAKLKDVSIPAIITLSEEDRRLKEMQEMYKDIAPGMFFEDKESITLNTSNEIIKNIVYLKKDDREQICSFVYDLAKINHRQMTDTELTDFTARMSGFLQNHTACVKLDTEVIDTEAVTEE